MTEMSKKTILDGWKRLATDPRLDDCITTPASQCWQFFDELLKKSDDNTFFENDHVPGYIMKELQEFAKLPFDYSPHELYLSLPPLYSSCMMNEYAIDRFNEWMLQHSPYVRARKTFSQILRETAASEKPDDTTPSQPPARTCHPLKPVLERQLGMLVAASEKAVQDSDSGQLCALSQAIAALTELLLKM